MAAAKRKIFHRTFARRKNMAVDFTRKIEQKQKLCQASQNDIDSTQTRTKTDSNSNESKTQFDRTKKFQKIKSTATLNEKPIRISAMVASRHRDADDVTPKNLYNCSFSISQRMTPMTSSANSLQFDRTTVLANGRHSYNFYSMLRLSLAH